MVDEAIPPDIDRQLDEAVGNKPKSTSRRPPVYKVVGSSKIPVSKSYGKIWESRRDNTVKVNESLKKAWEEAISYFLNDQTPHRDSSENKSGNLRGNQRLNDNITETENVVFANVTTMVPALYSRNPTVEVTAEDVEEQEPLATVSERLINALMRRKASPGINIKPKVKRCIVTSLLTNRSWLVLDWVFKTDSSEQALEDLGKLAEELKKAKTPKAIERIEGKISALEEAVDLLGSSGPTLVYKGPTSVIVDPNAQEIDLTDARWIMVEDMFPTSFLIARYGKEGKDETKSIFQPTHIMKLGDNSEDDQEGSNFTLFDNDEDAAAKDFGFSDAEAFRRAKMTKVWRIYDKVTRRIFMYNDKDWTWPIWVWDDPYRLDTFFPVYPLTFYDSPAGQFTKGEVTYYLDQQDAINEITDEERRARLWARRNVFYNNLLVTQEDVNAILNGPDGTARGLKVPEGMKPEDIIFSIAPPSLKHKEIFDKEGKYAAIDRISSVGEVMRGAQFKTNTTNDAVQANVAAANLRVDEKTDAVEDCIGQVGWGMLQMCLQFMDEQNVVDLIGKSAVGVWRRMEPKEIRTTLELTIVGGSTQKPTSQAKKQEALEIGQVLGQFVNSAPGPVLKVMLEVFQSAFDEINIKEEDWEEIKQAIISRQQQGQNAQPGNGADPSAQLQQQLEQLPPEAQAAVQQSVQKGVPLAEAIQAVTRELSNQTVQ